MTGREDQKPAPRDAGNHVAHHSSLTHSEEVAAAIPVSSDLGKASMTGSQAGNNLEVPGKNKQSKRTVRRNNFLPDYT